MKRLVTGATLLTVALLLYAVNAPGKPPPWSHAGGNQGDNGSEGDKGNHGGNGNQGNANHSGNGMGSCIKGCQSRFHDCLKSAHQAFQACITSDKCAALAAALQACEEQGDGVSDQGGEEGDGGSDQGDHEGVGGGGVLQGDGVSDGNGNNGDGCEAAAQALRDCLAPCRDDYQTQHQNCLTNVAHACLSTCGIQLPIVK